MAFVTLEDFYGSAEIIIFDSIYSKVSNIIIEDNIILVDGRLSIREDEPVKIVASNVKEFSQDILDETSKKSETKLNTIKTLNINITNLTEEQKQRLRGTIKFFTGDRLNVKLEITDNGEIKPCGGIYLTDKILEVFQSLVSKENIVLK